MIHINVSGVGMRDMAEWLVTAPITPQKMTTKELKRFLWSMQQQKKLSEVKVRYQFHNQCVAVI